jgi:hypothetical protein
MLLFDPLFEFANLLTPAMGLALVVRQKAPASLDVLGHLLASNLAGLAHDKAVLATIAIEVKSPATLFAVFTSHANKRSWVGTTPPES